MITEDKVREVLEKWNLGFKIVEHYFSSVNRDELRRFRISNSVIEFSFYFGDSCYNNFNTIRGDLDIEYEYSDYMSGKCDLSMFKDGFNSLDWNRIQNMLRDLISLITQPSTLEEKVREILEPLDVEPGHIEHCGSHVSVKIGDTFRLIYSDRLETVSAEGAVTKWDVDAMPVSAAWKEAYKNIAALLSPQTETELEERVRELEEELKKQENRAESWSGFYEKAAFRADTAEAKVKTLQDQLDNSVSEADHEREMQNWQSAFETVQKERDEARKEAERFKQAFFREYFNRQPVLDLSKEDSYP